MSQSLFMVIRRYGGPYDPRAPLEEQADWEAHRTFMNVLEGRGLARLAGPLECGEDVLLIFRAESRDAGLGNLRLAFTPESLAKHIPETVVSCITRLLPGRWTEKSVLRSRDA